MQATTPEVEDPGVAVDPGSINVDTAGDIAQNIRGELGAEEESAAEREQKRVDQLFSSGNANHGFGTMPRPLLVFIDPRLHHRARPVVYRARLRPSMPTHFPANAPQRD